MTFDANAHAQSSDEPMLTCTVVICTRNRSVLLLDRCLEALAKVTYPFFKVLVVDNAPSDASAREIAVRWGASYVVEPVPGLSRARNCGARACSTDIIAFLDDDSLPKPTWISSLVPEFKDSRVMAVTGRVVPYRIETEAERLCALASGLVPFGLERRVLDRGTPSWFEMASFGGIGDGMNMAFRREAFDVVTGFDERLGRGTPIYGGEEHHAFFSLIQCGFRVVYTPQAVVSHPYPETMQDLRSRYLSDLRAATAYLTFLFVKERQYRWAILKYTFEAVRGIRRIWRGEAEQPRRRFAPRWRVVLAYLSGPFLYIRSRLTRERHLNYFAAGRNRLSPQLTVPSPYVPASSPTPRHSSPRD